jgi:hypothetical protein
VSGKFGAKLIFLSEMTNCDEAASAIICGQWPNGVAEVRLQPVKFECEDESQLREVRFSSVSVKVGDPVRVAVAGVEVEGRIEGVESSTLHVRIPRDR